MPFDPIALAYPDAPCLGVETQMKFWSTCETSDDVSGLPDIMLVIESRINHYLEGARLENEFSGWVVIYFCMREEFLDFFSETIVARRKPEKVMEFRLKIDHSEFTSSDKEHKISLMLDVLLRSIEKMGLPKFKVSDADRGVLASIASRVRVDLL